MTVTQSGRRVTRPTSIEICGQPFEVVGVPLGELIHRLEPGDRPSHDPTQSYGVSAMHLQRIAIRDGMAPASERDTLLHEVLHCIVRATSSFTDFESAQAEEDTVNALAVGLLAVLRQNPDLVAWLVA